LVHLERHQVLFRVREPLRSVHFPLTAVVSLITPLESGESLEVGLVGRDGIAETAVFPGVASMSCDGVVRISGAALKITAAVLGRAMQASESLCCVVARHTQLMLVRSMQMSACNAFHSVEQRCARWLLTVHDLTGETELPITQELLATMLGVRRPTVTLVLASLRRARLVAERRGRIRITDRGGLQAVSCECYRVMRADQVRLLGY
jgi:CRP-like cAMP-binding protein